MVLRHRSVLTSLAAAGFAASAALTGPAAVAAPTAGAAYPTSSVDVSYGATYVRGTLTWFNRSVGFQGTYRAIESSGCRRAWFGTYTASGDYLDARSTSTLCNGTKPITTAIPADVPGGAASVVVCLDDADAVPLKCVKYERP